MKTTTVNCPLCQSRDVSVIQRQLTAKVDERAFSYCDEHSQCDECGEGFYTREQSLANSRAYTAALRKVEGLLTPEEIRGARVRLRMTQPQFERALGVGKKTVVRWERGTVPPSRGANVALWLAANYPTVFLEYADGRVPEIGQKFGDLQVVGRIFTTSLGETVAETRSSSVRKKSARKAPSGDGGTKGTLYSGKESMSV